MIYADKLIDIIQVLEDDGLVLMPTDTLWSIAVSMKSNVGFARLNNIVTPSYYPIIIVKDLMDIKRYIPRFHPRVETLMSIYERPLTITKPNVGAIASILPDCTASKIGFHVAMDDFTKRIIDLLGNPLLVFKIPTRSQADDQSFNDIPEAYLSAVSYVCKHRQADVLADGVAAGYDSEGNLIFE
jgi:tRNA A37 threonylcarbamoyladenosine synthetase subunit TsaC/SUA5/YrdC